MGVESWTRHGHRITDEEVLARLEATMADVGPVIVEHRFYAGSRDPHWFVVTNLDDRSEHLATRTSPGDSFRAWSFADVCTDENVLARGKVPDADGKTPVGGSY